MTKMHTKDTVLKTIMDRSIQQGDCLIWTGSLSGGYGRIGYKGNLYLVHRLVYTLTYGNTDLLVLHTCDNPPCWNIEHLYVGTDQDNANDRCVRGRQGSAPGNKNSQAKLTEDEVRQIILEYKPFYITCKQLATKFNVSASAISKIVSGRTWLGDSR